MKKNILLVKGESKYDAMRIYIDELAKEFRKFGYNTLVLDCLRSDFGVLLEKATKDYKFDFIMTCNAIVVKEFRIPNIPYITYLCDHPIIHDKRNKCFQANDIVFTCDRKDISFIHRYYKNIKNVWFLPLSGTYVEEQLDWDKRDIDIIFTGSYENPEEIKKKILSEFTGVLRKFIKYMIDDIEKNPKYMIEEYLERALKYYKVFVDDIEFYELLKEIYFILNFYARFYYRDKIIREIIQADIKIHIFGEGWENLQSNKKDNLIIEKGSSYIARKKLANAKIALNIMPWFKEGFQERIASGMLSGCVALTDSSSYIEENFKDKNELVIYYLEEIQKLPQIIKDILNNKEKSMQIAKKGKEKALQKYKWEDRAREILQSFYGKDIIITGEKKGRELQVSLNENYLERRDNWKKDIKQFISWCEEIEQYSSFTKEDIIYEKDQLDKINYYVSDIINIEKDREFFNTFKPMDIAAQQLLGKGLKYYAKGLYEEFVEAENISLKNNLTVIHNQKEYLEKQIALIVKERVIRNYIDIDDDEIQEIVKRIQNVSVIQAYNSNFIDKYLNILINVYYDESCNMHFVYFMRKKMYYPVSYSIASIISNTRFILMEQDKDSPHCYLSEEFNIQNDEVVIDAGVAEGNFSLAIIDKVKKLYLIECEDCWIEALKKTFEPYKEKVVIVSKMLGNIDDETHITIDTLIGNEEVNFIKMDIEGMEEEALLGAKNVLENNQNIKCAICVYHRKGADYRIKKYLEEKGFYTSVTKGYMFFREDIDSLIDGELRRGILQGIKQK